MQHSDPGAPLADSTCWGHGTSRHGVHSMEADSIPLGDYVDGHGLPV
jgi:hypothetical protein